MTEQVLDLTTRIGNVTVEGVIGNSPGPRKSIEECHEVGKSASAVITVGSMTAKARQGNEGNVYWSEGAPERVLNSLGLPNPPLKYYSERVDELKVYGKPVVLSLAGFSVTEFEEMLEEFAGRGFILELNETCPNVEGKGIFAHDQNAVRATIKAAKRLAPHDQIILKTAQHPDTPGYIQPMCEMFNDEGIDALAVGNTLANCLVIDPVTLKPVITPNNGLAGLSGTSIHPIMMGQVAQYRRFLRPEISIICEGGINTGWDILSYFLAGGDFCRSAARYGEKGPGVFTDLTLDFIEEMEKRGFHSLADIPRLMETAKI